MFVPAPSPGKMSKLAKQHFASLKIPLPANWTVNAGHPHYRRAFKAGQLAVPLLPLGPFAGQFASVSSNWYHAKTQKVISSHFQRYLNGICKAICCAWKQWCEQATLKGVTITAANAMGGMVTGPKWEPIINDKGPHATTMEKAYTKSIAKAVGEAWSAYETSIKVPGLPWYPPFAAWAGPVAPPTKNIPATVAQLTQVTATLEKDALKGAMVGNLLGEITLPVVMSIASQGGFDPVGAMSLLTGPLVLHGPPLCEAVAVAFDTCFKSWQTGEMVTDVMGKGPVPTFAPPAVPAGPVAGGIGDMLPGGFNSGMVDMDMMKAHLQVNEGDISLAYDDKATGPDAQKPLKGLNLGGKTTIGVGFNLEDRADARQLIEGLGHDFDAVMRQEEGLITGDSTKLVESVTRTDFLPAMTRLIPNFGGLPSGAQVAALDIMYQKGPTAFARDAGGFINALKAGDTGTALTEMDNILVNGSAPGSRVPYTQRYSSRAGRNKALLKEDA